MPPAPFPLEHFQKALEQKPDDEQAFFGKAVALHQLERWEEARSLYAELLERNPQQENALRNMVALGIQTRDDAVIERYAERLLAIDGQAPGALNALAARAFHAGDYEQAAEYCRRSLAATPEDFETWFNLGVAEQRLGRWAEAAEAYKKAIAIRPDAKAAGRLTSKPSVSIRT